MPSREHDWSDPLLIGYLLGKLPDDQAVPIEQASVTDDQFALRLRSVEYDLVDSYVRGDLDEETRARFEAWYLRSALRRERVAMARTLLQRAGTEKAAPPGPSPWMLAAAAALFLVVVPWVVMTLRSRPEPLVEAVDRAPTAEATPVSTGTPIVAAAPPGSGATTSPTPARVAEAVTAIAVVLHAQTRSGSDLVTASITADVEVVEAQLHLEFDEFETYRATLEDPADDRVLWRSGPLRASGAAARRIVSARIPAGELRSQNYTIELEGLAAGGTADFVGSYAVRVVRQ